MSEWPRWPLPELDPRRLLWNESRMYRAPQANAAAVLEAHLPELAAQLARDPARRDAWWAQPRAYWWTRRALGLSGADLTEHLREFAASDPAAEPGVPIARHAGYALPLEPRAFAIPGYRHAEPALAAGRAYQEQNLALVEQTLAAIERYVPELFTEFRRAIRVIALKPPEAGGYDDFSNPELPGSFIASAVPDPFELADHFLHELQHNRLSFLEECGPLFGEPSCVSAWAGGCYSPWRDEPRSLYGVYHGVYVFAAVYRYWRRVHDAGDAPSHALAMAQDRLLRLPGQLALAVALIGRDARLTPFGAALFAQLARDVEAIRRDARELKLASAAPVRAVHESLLAHVARHPARAQCDGLVHLLRPEVAAA